MNSTRHPTTLGARDPALGTLRGWTRHTFCWMLCTILSLLEPSSTPSSMSSLVEKLPDASDRRVRCIATAVFWIRFHTFPHVGDTNSAILHAFNPSASKCSQIRFQKDRRGTSTRGFPPTPTLMPSIMTTNPTATSRMKVNPLALKRKMKDLSKANTTQSRDRRTR